MRHALIVLMVLHGCSNENPPPSVARVCGQADQQLTQGWESMARAIRAAHEAACSRGKPEDREPCLIMAKPSPAQVADARKNIRGHRVSELPTIVPWIYAGEVGK